MTDQTDNTQSDLATTAETFAALRAGRTSHPRTSVREAGAYEGSMSRAVAAGVALAGEDEAHALAVQRARGATASGLTNDAHALDKRLAEIDTLMPTARPEVAAALELERKSLHEERFIVEMTRGLVAQRDAASADRSRVKVEDDAATHDFVNGDPRRKAALDDAMLRKEAEVMADWLLRRRYGLTK
jgi:hypothetical protein